ncbi:MAG: hypothetical protein QRY71_05620 [Candidatus Rhabdochlamydia sp.]
MRELPFKCHINKFFIILQKRNLFLLLPLLLSCSGLEESEKHRLKEQQAKGEYIYRYSHEEPPVIPDPLPKKKAPYPWENKDP